MIANTFFDEVRAVGLPIKFNIVGDAVEYHDDADAGYRLQVDALAEKHDPVAAAVLEKWQADMAATDGELPRWAEDLWDQIGADNAPEIVRDRLAAKKALRAERP